ncbi:T-cell surface glycoprotein CD3 zeta chain-like isoform X1 [Phyllopteryx taeniolatus]|uniref:T-cell surface glycoprotein CD3 zeta chain-like isoform X1 n=1 Tax=Phyllopteryx taeniolatus TaxID=161469 RepID=UPI002AD59868|nr:T-cell surface glycoprotein CD3 zeta chain-like isoform X1 [Phyllopteryx taeniolatus]
MGLWWTSGLLVLAIQPADAMLTLYDPKLCYILDGFLGLYGLVITAMFIKEKFFKTKGAPGGGYTGTRGQGADGDLTLRGDPERGRNHWMKDNATYTDLKRRTEDEYKELPVQRERPRKNHQVYQGLSPATRDTYDALQKQAFPTR